MIYVMSDIHGEYEKFLAMLEQIKFNNNDTLYILGDVVDRGSESIKCLQYIMHKPNIKMILGNHEEMMLRSLINGDRGYYNCWMGNGGYNTLRKFDDLSIDFQHKILDYLQQLPLTITISDFEEDYILVHAGVNFDEDTQDRETVLWARDEFIYGNDRFDGVTVIFGHTPTKYMQNIKPYKIWNTGNGKIGIDCGACFEGGQLGCLRLDDMKEFYV
jgi:serine/threonine protein phosphatase 1